MFTELGKKLSTFTMIGRCQRTGLLGIAITSSPIAVASRCPFIQPNLAAVATQAYANPKLGPFALKLLSLGYSAEATLREIEGSDKWSEYRQIGIVDYTGAAAVFTGDKNDDWKGSVSEKNFIAMGNFLAGGQVVDAMAKAFRDSEKELLEERLIRALEAGRDAGGEKAGQLSSGLIVYGKDPYPRTCLRVDMSFSGDPIQDLRRIYNDYANLIPYYEQRPMNPEIGSWREW